MIKLIFGIINLIAFLALLYYFFRKNYIPRLQRELVDRVGEIDDLKKEYRRVVDRQAQLDNKQIFQEAHFKTLLLKVKQWRSVVEDKRAEWENESTVLKQHFVEKRARIERALMLSSYRKKVEPRVLAELINRLDFYYKDDACAKNYLEKSLESFFDVQGIKHRGNEQ